MNADGRKSNQWWIVPLCNMHNNCSNTKLRVGWTLWKMKRSRTFALLLKILASAVDVH